MQNILVCLQGHDSWVLMIWLLLYRKKGQCEAEFVTL
jgi:hypothetical protein